MSNHRVCVSRQVTLEGLFQIQAGILKFEGAVVGLSIIVKQNNKKNAPVVGRKNVTLVDNLLSLILYHMGFCAVC